MPEKVSLLHQLIMKYDKTLTFDINPEQGAVAMMVHLAVDGFELKKIDRKGRKAKCCYTRIAPNIPQ